MLLTRRMLRPTIAAALLLMAAAATHAMGAPSPRPSPPLRGGEGEEAAPAKQPLDAAQIEISTVRDGGRDIGFDDLQFSAELHLLLVPAGRTGRLALVGPGSGSVEAVEGFSRSAAGGRGHAEGTTSADAGQGHVFAIDRTDRTLVAVDPGTRRLVARAKLGGVPDYVRWVDPTREVWVTEPEREWIEIFRFQGGAAPALTRTGTISVPAGPESLAVDPGHARAYTNTFKDATVAIDVRHRTVVASWLNGCRGARGIALDAGRGWVFVGCDEGKAVALDVARGGRTVGVATTGDGVDSIAYSPQLGHLYVPAADTGTLSIIAVGEHGQLDPLGTSRTARGAHCAAADDRGNVFVCDPRRGRLLVLRDPYPPSRDHARAGRPPVRRRP
jgi:DNA-binding beta-propeller fold protein YncE